MRFELCTPALNKVHKYCCGFRSRGLNVIPIAMIAVIIFGFIFNSSRWFELETVTVNATATTTSNATSIVQNNSTNETTQTSFNESTNAGIVQVKTGTAANQEPIL